MDPSGFWNDDIDVRLARKVAVLRVVVGALHVLDARRNRNRAAEMRSPEPGETLEIGKKKKNIAQVEQRDSLLPGRAAEFVATDAFEKIAREFAGVEKFLEGEMGIDAGRDDFGGDFFAALQRNAAGAAALDNDFRDARLRANFDAGFASGVGDGVRDSSGPAAAESPRAKRSINFAHVVMQKNVGSPRRANAKKGPNDARGRHRGLEELSGPAKNHWSRKSAALMVMSCTRVYRLSDMERGCENAVHEEVKLLEIAVGLRMVGSGGIIESSGFTKRHIGVIIFENSS